MGFEIPHITTSELMEKMAASDSPAVVDVRRAPIFADAKVMLPGAVWKDFRQADSWGAKLPRNREVVVYCVHGHEVSQTATLLLRMAGVSARYLEGGIEGFIAAGGAVTEIPR